MRVYLHQWVTSYQKPSRSAAAAATASSGTSNAARFRATPKEILAMVEVLKKETEMLVRKDADEEDSKRATAALRGFRA